MFFIDNNSVATSLVLSEIFNNSSIVIVSLLGLRYLFLLNDRTLQISFLHLFNSLIGSEKMFTANWPSKTIITPTNYS